MTPTEREPVPAKTQRDSPAGTVRETVSGTVREGSQEPGWSASYHGLFPPALAARFRSVQPLPAFGGEADCYLLGDGGQRVFAKVYHRGKSPNATVLERLRGAAADKVVRVIDSAPPGEGGERAWELLEYMPEGSLSDLIAREGPRLPPDRVRQIVFEITDALDHVHRLGVEHRDLKPANVLIRTSEPFDLVLADFGIASLADQSMRFTSGHQTLAYGPPEALSGALYAERWDSWSLGMMLVEMLTGHHPLMLSGADQEDELHQRRMRSIIAIADPEELVAEVTGADWIKLCRGLLRRDPKLRWTTKEVLAWLQNPKDVALKVADDRPTADAKPLRVEGIDCRTREDLVAASDRTPGLLANLWKRRPGDLMNWLLDELGDRGAADSLQKLQSSKLSLDAQLMILLSVLAPERPATFRGTALSPESLAAIADKAFSGQSAARSLLLSLYDDGVLRLAPPPVRAESADPGRTQERGQGGLLAIDVQWRNAVADFEGRSSALTSQSGGVASAGGAQGDTLLSLIAAATPGSNAAEALCRQAQERVPAAAWRCLWFQTLGAPHPSTPVVNLLVMLTAGAAAAQVSAAADARVARNNAIWNAMGAGAAIGLVIGFVWWWGVASWCGGGEKTCIDHGWFGQHLNGYDLLFLVAAIAAVLALLTSIHQQTGQRD